MDQLEQFTCDVCEVTFSYKFHGRYLDDLGIKDIELLEEAFVILDPFVPTKDFLVLGGHCSVCNAVVCVDRNCSLFYCRRFCRRCALSNSQEFPTAITKELKYCYNSKISYLSVPLLAFRICHIIELKCYFAAIKLYYMLIRLYF
uniref:Cysteine-rich DPF motif domain-containing protein 1 n=1 Tax=Ciona savignyi TaxID=51511 RepID=H2ZQU6_CIOSA